MHTNGLDVFALSSGSFVREGSIPLYVVEGAWLHQYWYPCVKRSSSER
jgi:hypothetical protein